MMFRRMQSSLLWVAVLLLLSRTNDGAFLLRGGGLVEHTRWFSTATTITRGGEDSCQRRQGHNRCWFSSSSSSSSSSSLDEEAASQDEQDRETTTTATKIGQGRDGRDYLPANLRRSVQASRPPLGHVVPARYKVRGGKSNPVLRPQGKERDAGLNNPSLLRILAGTAKGRRLDSPQVYLRPMMGKVKEALFSTLEAFGLFSGSNRIRHLDVFAGSGSVGLESLSRGASHCTFVDLSRDCCDAVARNLGWCFEDEEEERGTVLCAEALEFLKDPTAFGTSPQETYDLVTLCPPYEEVVYADLLQAVVDCPAIAEDAVIVVEYPVELGSLPPVVGGSLQLLTETSSFAEVNQTVAPSETPTKMLLGVRNRRYGRTVIAIYVVNPTNSGKMLDVEASASRPEEFITVARGGKKKVKRMKMAKRGL